MALFRDDSGKTEKPTAGRLSQASDKGQVPLSREFTTAASLLVAVIAIMSVIGEWLMDAFAAQMRYGLNVDLREHFVADASAVDIMLELEAVLRMIVWPFVTLIGLLVVSTALAGYLQIGFKMRSEALKIDLARLNPASNISKVFNLSSVVRTSISALKLVVLGLVLWLVLRAHLPEFALMYEHASFAQSVGVIADTAFEILLWISTIVLLISLGDVVWQRFDHIEKLKMSKQEVEDERKRTDGDPLIKSRLRRAALEIMQQRMMESVPKADVVITNPTHFSVALRYDRTRNRAPEVVAKGADEVALHIRELARAHGVPLMEDPPLARALFRAVRIGKEVPERFYQAVAAVLSQIYRMREEVA